MNKLPRVTEAVRVEVVGELTAKGGLDLAFIVKGLALIDSENPEIGVMMREYSTGFPDPQLAMQAMGCVVTAYKMLHKQCQN